MDPIRDMLIVKDAEAAARTAADRLLETAVAAVAAGACASIALSGGATPRAMQRLLAGEPYAAAVPWERIHLFWGDERLVPGSDSGQQFRRGA